jgi:hypothetical protein
VQHAERLGTANSGILRGATGWVAAFRSCTRALV